MNKKYKLLLSVLMVFPFLTACSADAEKENDISETLELFELMNEKLDAVESFTATCLFNIEGEYTLGDDVETNNKFIVISETNEEVYLKNNSVHTETFTKLSVNENDKNEIIEQYFIPKEYGEYYHYLLHNVDAEDNEWIETTLTKKDASSIMYNTGYINDWISLLELFDTGVEIVEDEEKSIYRVTGNFTKEQLTTILAVDVLNGFYNRFLLFLEEDIPVELFVDSETILPVKIKIDVESAFQSEDIYITSSEVYFEFNSFDHTPEIQVPKRISVTSKNNDVAIVALNGSDLFGRYFSSPELEPQTEQIETTNSTNDRK